MQGTRNDEHTQTYKSMLKSWQASSPLILPVECHWFMSVVFIGQLPPGGHICRYTGGWCVCIEWRVRPRMSNWSWLVTLCTGHPAAWVPPRNVFAPPGSTKHRARHLPRQVIPACHGERPQKDWDLKFFQSRRQKTKLCTKTCILQRLSTDRKCFRRLAVWWSLVLFFASAEVLQLSDLFLGTSDHLHCPSLCLLELIVQKKL